MDSPFPSWITKTMIRGVKGFNLDAYLMALEGWRRGLTLTWYLDPSEVTNLKVIGHNPIGKAFSLKNNENGKIHYFYRSRGDKVSNEAVDLVRDKYHTKLKLIEAGVSTPKGLKFEKNDKVLQIINRFKMEKFEYPVVVKPTLGSLGKGVITNIINEEQLEMAISELLKNDRYDQFIIEEYIEGEEFRLYVVGGEVVAATKLIPAHVIGDGKSTIRELIKEKNNQRKNNPYLKDKLIKIDQSIEKMLEKYDLTLDSVPEINHRILLKAPSNIAVGGEPIDVTDEITENAKIEAVKAVQAIPNLIHAGVDLIITNESAYIIEINSTPDIVKHIFPIKGKPRNIPEKIIDYYFPETKKLANKNNKLYFNYRDVRNALRKHIAQEIVITDAPKGKLYSTRYIVSGKVQKVGYRAWIRRQANKCDLHGYTRNLKNGKVVVVVASNDLEKLKEFKNICYEGPKKAKVENVQELDWNSSINIGFEIRKTKT